MRVYLIRHGIAIERDDPECPPEFDRYLTREGIARTKQAMAGLQSFGDTLGAIFTSPLVRAAQTARIAADAWRFDPDRIRTTDALRPDAAPKTLLAELAKLDVETAACFGHAPNLDEVLAALVGAKTAFTALKKSGVAQLEMAEPRPGGATLLALYPSGALRRVK